MKPDKLLIIALFLAVIFHGSGLLFNLDKTYDAFVHIFFADHYARWWFDPWDYRWYTGFPTVSYPPLSHQLIALLSMAVGLKVAFVIVCLSFLCFFVLGIYRFSKILVPNRSAGYAAIYAVFASSIVQTIHIYGQLPTVIGISCLLNALPEIYAYFRTGRRTYLLTALPITAVGVASHHVTTIFGMVFFILPIVATALLDENGTEGKFFAVAKSVITLAFKKYKLFLIFFPITIFEIVVTIFPYWYYSKTDPITQVSIPHGSRDSFIEVITSGMMFFIIPLGFSLLLLPYIFRCLFTRRNIFLALSFCLLLLFGTGGTTPIPKMILGKNAFNILTLDRFTFWASILAIPFVGNFFYRLVEGDLRKTTFLNYSKNLYRVTYFVLTTIIAFQALYLINFHKIYSLEPPSIDIKPILNFIDRDEHYRWRYMTLGFGDQMAWLSANTTALSIDGNYHSARRVPEMTTQPIERLENSKFKGVQGIGSLQQFLTIPEKYNLKFIFSNDKFYDPILYFAGWERILRLENGIMIWQKHDVPPLPSVLPKKETPTYQRLMWGILPVTAFCWMLITLFFVRKRFIRFEYEDIQKSFFLPTKGLGWLFLWMGLLVSISAFTYVKSELTPIQNNPERTLKAYYHDIDFKNFQEATQLFIPKSITFDEFITQVSLNDRLLAAYSKLDSISVKIISKKDNLVKARVYTDWISSLERYHVEFDHELVNIDGKWYIKPEKFSKYLPPDEHIEKGVLALHGQGKRNIGMPNVEHDDVLDRPELYVISAKLIKQDSSYIVVGEIQNTDYLAGHLTIEAQLFDENNKKIVAYNAKYTTLHKVLPKEIVPFRIEFESTAWVKNEDNNPLKFNPKEFSQFDFTKPPTHFKIFARAVVADKDIYRDVGVQGIRLNDKSISGEIYNYGTEEISIPQLLFTYYNNDGEVVWVDHTFLRNGARTQLKTGFTQAIPDFSPIKLIKTGTIHDFSVNGLPQDGSLNHYQARPRLELIPLPNQAGFVRVQVNSFIADPTIY